MAEIELNEHEEHLIMKLREYAFGRIDAELIIPVTIYMQDKHPIRMEVKPGIITVRL